MKYYLPNLKSEYHSHCLTSLESENQQHASNEIKSAMMPFTELSSPPCYSNDQEHHQYMELSQGDLSDQDEDTWDSYSNQSNAGILPVNLLGQDELQSNGNAAQQGFEKLSDCGGSTTTAHHNKDTFAEELEGLDSQQIRFDILNHDSAAAGEEASARKHHLNERTYWLHHGTVDPSSDDSRPCVDDSEASTTSKFNGSVNTVRHRRSHKRQQNPTTYEHTPASLPLSPVTTTNSPPQTPPSPVLSTTPAPDIRPALHRRRSQLINLQVIAASNQQQRVSSPSDGENSSHNLTDEHGASDRLSVRHSAHTRVNSSSSFSTLSPYTTSYVKYNRYMDESFATASSGGFGFTHPDETSYNNGWDSPLASRAFNSPSPSKSHFPTLDEQILAPDSVSISQQQAMPSLQQDSNSIQSLWSILCKYLTPTPAPYVAQQVLLQKRQRVDGYFSQYWRILKCPFTSSASKQDIKEEIPSSKHYTSYAPSPLPAFPTSIFFSHPSSDARQDVNTEWRVIFLLSLFISFILFLFIHLLPETGIYGSTDSLSSLQSCALIFVAFVLLGAVVQGTTTNSPLQLMDRQHETLLSQIESFFPKLRLFNCKIHYLLSLIVEVQMIAKGYQIVFPLNSQVVSNLEWNSSSLSQESGIGAHNALRSTILDNLLFMNEYVEMCIEYIRRNIGVEDEFNLLQGDARPGNQMTKSAALDGSTAYEHRKPQLPQDGTIPSRSRSASTASEAEFSLTLKYLKLKHLELKQNAKTLSQLLLHLCQQSDVASMIPSHIVVHSFEELAKSPLMDIGQHFDWCLEDLKKCEANLIGLHQTTSGPVKASQKTPNAANSTEAPIQVLTEKYFLSRMNTSISELRAHLNMFQHMRSDLRDGKASVAECERTYHKIRNELFGQLQSAFEESALFYLKSVTPEEDRMRHHDKTGDLWNDTLEDAKEVAPNLMEKNADVDSFEPAVFHDASADILSASQKEFLNKSAEEQLEAAMKKKTSVYTSKPPVEDERNDVKDAGGMGFKLPSLSEAHKKRKVSFSAVGDVSSDEEEDTQQQPQNDLNTRLGRQQQAFLHRMSNSVSRSQKEPRSVLMSEMKNVLAQRVREVEYYDL